MSVNQSRHHILVVDDEDGVRTLLRECLEQEGFVVSEAETGSQLKSILDQATVDLITLDLGLGGESGFDLARQVRASRDVPIIMITGKGDTIDRVVGLELGADDYITKPFQLREVVARVRAVLRRYEALPAPGVPEAGAGEERYAFAGWLLDVPQRVLRNPHGAISELTTNELDLLVAFVRRPRRVLSRDTIMDLLKGQEWSPLDRSIDALVVRLRRKVEANPSSPQLIKTVRGIGYVFAVPADRL